jgi:hypothetical protein
MRSYNSAMLATLMVAAANTAAAQAPVFREGEPPVLVEKQDAKKERDAIQQTLVSDFQSAYQKAKRPKVALFWNRTLGDSITSIRETSSSVSASGSLPWQNYRIAVDSQTNVGSQKAYSTVAPPRAAEFQTGLQSVMRSAGVAFVDRSAIVRLAALSKSKNGQQTKDLDFQTIEMSALADYADYFAEVNFIIDASAKDGAEVRVTLIDTRTGEIAADVVPVDLYKPDSTNTRWSETERGFVKEQDDTVGNWTSDETGFTRRTARRTGVDEGRAVAYAVLEQWLPQLRARTK